MQLPKDRRGWLKVLAVLAAAVGAYLAFRALAPDIDPEELLADVSETLGQWTYLAVAVLAFLETGAFVGLVAPGETFVVLAGAVAGQGETNVILTIGIVWLAAFLGDTVSYILGVKLGRGFILKHGPRLRITKERFNQVERYFDKHGGKTILIGRFIGLVRALAPFIAGSSGMRYGAMAPYSVLGTGLWATTFTLLGYFASKSIDEVLHNAERALFAFAVIVAVVVGTVVAVRWLRVEENREKAVRWMEERRGFRGLVALGRRLTPQARFLWNRLTPGGLGLELTTALSVLAVGSYVVIGYAIVTGDNPGPTPGDREAANIAADLRADWLTTLSEIVTWFGTWIATVLVTAATAAWLWMRGHRAEMVVLLVGVAAILLLPALLKEIVDRPRPDGGLVDADDGAYPSGHAAHAVIYAWIALQIALRLKPGMRRATALIVAGIGLTVAVGLTRVYLGVHYMSDVSGGWALGASVFALLAVVALLVGHIRHNGRAMERAHGP